MYIWDFKNLNLSFIVEIMFQSCQTWHGGISTEKILKNWETSTTTFSASSFNCFLSKVSGCDHRYLIRHVASKLWLTLIFQLL